MRKFFKTVFWLLFLAGLAFVALRFGPNLYARFFGGGHTAWVSERFSEQLKEKNELVVFETTITGQETATQDAWLLGTVQRVIIPYTYDIRFTVDLSQSQITASDNTILVRLPVPKAAYSKLTVNEDQMKKNDWLYPLTPERYAAIKEEIESKLFQETAFKQEYVDAAWDVAVKNVEGLFQSVAQQSSLEGTCEIRVMMFDPALVPTESPSAAPIATPAAAV